MRQSIFSVFFYAFILTTASGQQAVSPKEIFFTEIGKEAGLVFKHEPPLFDEKIRHINPLWANFIAPVAVGDFNNDGLDDIFFVSSRPDKENALYKNLGQMKFENVAGKAGLAALNNESNVGSGALWFDYNNDGWQDLLVLRLGTNLLFKNNGNETFTNVTTTSGLGGTHQNSIAAIAFDFDRDGDLDLLTGGFFADEVDLFHLTTLKILPNHGHLGNNGGTKTLYRNNRDGTFTNVSAAAGIKDTGFTTALGHGDYDNDGWTDFYIANDFGTDRLFHNNHNETFTDVTAAALGLDGKKGMNVEFGDFNNDGNLDIYVTNITEPWLKECNMLWMNWGEGILVDVSWETKTCDTGWGWGAKFSDFDNDGWLDLYVANGFISAGREDYAKDAEEWQKPLSRGETMDFSDAVIWPPIGTKTFAGYERNRLFRNLGDQYFAEIGGQAGVDSLFDGRGVAISDFDRDGNPDILVTNVGREPLLYQNQSGGKNNWLEIKLTGTQSNRAAIGTRVKVVSGNLSQIREINCGNGYQSQSTLILHFGLGNRTKIDLVEIKWTNGAKQTIKNIAPNQLLSVTENRAR